MMVLSIVMGNAAMAVYADELGTGRDDEDIPDTPFTNDTVDAQGTDGLWQVLAELFCLNDEIQR